jgi:hypothetical protein
MNEIITRMMVQSQDDIVMMHHILDSVIDITKKWYPNAKTSPIDIHFMNNEGTFHVIDRGHVVGTIKRNFETSSVDVIAISYHDEGSIIGSMRFGIDGSYDTHIYNHNNINCKDIVVANDWFTALMAYFDINAIKHEIELELCESSEESESESENE